MCQHQGIAVSPVTHCALFWNSYVVTLLPDAAAAVAAAAAAALQAGRTCWGDMRRCIIVDSNRTANTPSV